MGKGTKKCLQHRNDLKQQYPRGIAPLVESSFTYTANGRFELRISQIRKRADKNS